MSSDTGAPMQLVKYNAMCRAIAEAHALQEAKAMVDRAEALEAHAQQAGNTDAERQAAEIKIRAERRCGQLLNERARHKKQWVADTRAAFSPSDRSPCQVCGRYKSLSHAHHITPLTLQFDMGFNKPDHAHVWLCPTHHAAIHIFMNQVVTERIAAGSCQLDVLGDLSTREIRELLAILDQFKAVFYGVAA